MEKAALATILWFLAATASAQPWLPHQNATGCFTQNFFCGSNISDSISTSSCFATDGKASIYYDYYRIVLQPNTRLVISFRGVAFTGGIALYGENNTLIKFGIASSISTTATLDYSTSSGGTFGVLVSPIENYYIGPYTLTASCYSLSNPPPAPSCTSNSTTICLSGSRFAVSVAWKNHDSPPKAGSGQAVTMSSDTGNFWFFQSTNTELVVKVVDGRSLNGKWWVFFGALRTWSSR